MNAFDAAWDELAERGVVDGRGGMAYSRCKKALRGFATVDQWVLAIRDWAVRDEATSVAFIADVVARERKSGLKVRRGR